jgi:hypothetical protein
MEEDFGMVIEEDYYLSHLNFSALIEEKLAAHSEVTVLCSAGLTHTVTKL